VLVLGVQQQLGALGRNGKCLHALDALVGCGGHESISCSCTVPCWHVKFINSFKSANTGRKHVSHELMLTFATSPHWRLVWQYLNTRSAHTCGVGHLRLVVDDGLPASFRCFLCLLQKRRRVKRIHRDCQLLGFSGCPIGHFTAELMTLPDCAHA
jgi:hypothetical protein